MSIEIFSRDEVERAFHDFLRVGAYGHDWPAWSGIFTDDALYTEHCLGVFVGAEQIKNWIVPQMEMVPAMTFSIEWYDIVDNTIAFWIWNHLPDPSGEGARFDFPNFSLLTYAGNGKWSKEEDVYDPRSSEPIVLSWFKAGGNAQTPQDRTLRAPQFTHPSLPHNLPTTHQMDVAIAAAVPPDATLRQKIVNGARASLVYDTSERTYGTVLHVDGDGARVFQDDFTNMRENFTIKDVRR